MEEDVEVLKDWNAVVVLVSRGEANTSLPIRLASTWLDRFACPVQLS